MDLLAENAGLQVQLSQIDAEAEYLRGKLDELTRVNSALLVEKEGWLAERKQLEERLNSTERANTQLRATVVFLQEELTNAARSSQGPAVPRPASGTRKQPKLSQWSGDDEEEDGGEEHEACLHGRNGQAWPHWTEGAKKLRGSAVFAARGRGGRGARGMALRGGRRGRPAATPGTPKSKSALHFMGALETGDAAVRQAAESDAAGHGCLYWSGIRREGAKVEAMTDVGNSWEPGVVVVAETYRVQVRYDSLQEDDGSPLVEWVHLPWAPGREPDRFGVGFKLRPPQPKELYGDPVADFKKGAILECFAHEEGAWYPVELVGKQRGRYPSTGTPIAAAAGATAVTTSQTPGSDSGAERAEGPSSCGGIGVGEESEDAGDGAGPSGNGVCGGSGAAAGGRKAWVKFESDTDEGETRMVSMSDLRVPYAWLGCRWERLMAGSKRGWPVGSKNKVKVRKPATAAAMKLPTGNGNRYKIGRPLGTQTAGAGAGKSGANNVGASAGGEVTKKRGRPSGSGSGRVGRPPGKRAVSSQGGEASGDEDTSCPKAAALKSMHTAAVNDAPAPSARGGRGMRSPAAGKATSPSPAAAAPTTATAAAATQLMQGVMLVGGTKKRTPPARKPLAVRTTEAPAQPRPPRKRKAPAHHDTEDPALLETHMGSPSGAQAHLPPGSGVGSEPCVPAGDSVRQGASRVRKAKLSQNSTGDRGKVVGGVGGVAREERSQRHDARRGMGVPTPPSKPGEGSGAGTSGRGGGVKRGKARQDSEGQGPGDGHTLLLTKDQAQVVDVRLQTSQSRHERRRLARQAAHTGSKVGGCEGEGCPEALPSARKGRWGSAYSSQRVGAACAPMPEKKGVGGSGGKAQAAGVVTHMAGGKRAAPASAPVGGEFSEARRQSKRARK